MSTVNRCEVRNDWTLHIDAEIVLRAMGAHPRAMRMRQPRFVSLVERILAAEQDHFAPSAAIRTVRVREQAADRFCLESGTEIKNRVLCRRLAGAESVVVVVATIGKHFEDVSEGDDLPRRLIVDAIGTAGVAALRDGVLREAEEAARTAGLNRTNALQPGMKGWGLAEGQAQIFSMVDGRAAGVLLTESFMMRPKKSVSFLFGMGARVRQGTARCQDCDSAGVCRYKTHLYG